MPKRANIISLSELNRLFYFDESYRLRWKIKPSAKVHVEDIAGVLTKQKGFRVCIRGKNYQVHRILYQLYHNIEILDPRIEIDHIDLNRANNSPNNLRICTYSENSRNVLKHKDNISGYKGVFPNNSKKNPYRARIRHNGVDECLGCFPTAKEAHEAYCVRAKKVHGEFWNPG